MRPSPAAATVTNRGADQVQVGRPPCCPAPPQRRQAATHAGRQSIQREASVGAMMLHASASQPGRHAGGREQAAARGTAEQQRTSSTAAVQRQYSGSTAQRTCDDLADDKAVPRLKADARAHLAHECEGQAVAKVELAAKAGGCGQRDSTKVACMGCRRGHCFPLQPPAMLARLSPTTASAANPLPAHLRGMGSVPRGRLSLSSCLLLVSFCSTTVAREASSSSSCHWLIWFMLMDGGGLQARGGE